MSTTLVFDYDGTIDNTMAVYEPALRETCGWLLEHCPRKVYSMVSAAVADLPSERISSWLGMNAKDMWLDFMPFLDEDIREQASARVGVHMQKLVQEHRAHWYKGAAQTLDILHKEGYAMVILSNSKKIDGELHFGEFQMDRWFDTWYDCESFDWAPKTDIIKEVAKDYPGQLIVIGDRKSDIDAALSIGMKSVGCLYGYGTPEELRASDYQIEDIKELPEILGRL